MQGYPQMPPPADYTQWHEAQKRMMEERARSDYEMMQN
jgi:hypothetical protein